MKVQILIYKKQFTISDKEKEDYFRWWWLPEPEVKTKEDIEARLKRLRLQVEWTKRIAKKYHEAFLCCGKWQLNTSTNEITIL